MSFACIFVCLFVCCKLPAAKLSVRFMLSLYISCMYALLREVLAWLLPEVLPARVLFTTSPLYTYEKLALVQVECNALVKILTNVNMDE